MLPVPFADHLRACLCTVRSQHVARTVKDTVTMAIVSGGEDGRKREAASSLLLLT